MDPAEIAFHFAPVAIVYAEHRVIRKANPAFAQMFALTEAEVDGLSLELLYPSLGDSERIAATARDPLRMTGHYSDERTMQRRSGELFWCGAAGHAIVPSDPLASAVWCFQDLSRQWKLSDLSSRDREIAILTCEGKTAKQIAQLLDLSPRTVETYLARLKHKLDARNVAELVSRVRLGL